MTTFAQSVHAQVTKRKPKLISKAEYDKREVKRFIGSFIKALDETKDLNDVPSNFFVKDFKNQQTQAKYDFLEDRDVLDQLSIDDQFEHPISPFNFYYLMMMWNGGSWNFFLNKTDDDDDISKLLPRDVVEILKRSPFLANALGITVEKYDENELIEPSDVIEATKVSQEAVRLLKIAIENRVSSWKGIYAKNFKTARKQFADCGGKPCEGDSCIGLPEKTPIFWQAAFPLCFHLVRKNGKLKVFFIHIYTND